MDTRTIFIACCMSLILPAAAAAQTPADKAPGPASTACPSDTQAPTVGSPNPGTTGSGNLSDKLADSKGVICPPGGVDPEIRVAPPGGGKLQVIPPPGSPGGDPTVQPK